MLALLIGCDTGRPEVTTGVALADHPLSFSVPEGWSHANHHVDQRFSRSGELITLTDLGPVTAPGYQHALREARTLWRNGQLADARSHLEALDLRAAFRSEADWRAALADWRRIRGARSEKVPAASSGFAADPTAETEEAYQRLIDLVGRQPESALEELAKRALERLGHDRRRDLADIRTIMAAGRPAVQIDTWNRLDHRGRLSQLFLLDRGHLICLRMQLGRYADLEPAFRELAGSLRLTTSQESVAGT